MKEWIKGKIAWLLFTGLFFLLVFVYLHSIGIDLKFDGFSPFGFHFSRIENSDETVSNLSITQTVLAITQTQIALNQNQVNSSVVSTNTIPSDASKANQSFEVSVYANRGWQNSGISVNVGDNIEITYLSGEWTSEISSGGYFGPYTNKAPYVAACRPFPEWDAALIGKFGSSSEPFIVGYSYSTIAKVAGDLYLRMNDCDEWLQDNDGFLIIQIDKE
jgi:hypothetical protein